ncbi:MAG: hypothetical protein ACLPX5_02850 [Dissulfurispiraceae bacterium]
MEDLLRILKVVGLILSALVFIYIGYKLFGKSFHWLKKQPDSEKYSSDKSRTEGIKDIGDKIKKPKHSDTKTELDMVEEYPLDENLELARKVVTRKVRTFSILRRVDRNGNPVSGSFRAEYRPQSGIKKPMPSTAKDDSPDGEGETMAHKEQMTIEGIHDFGIEIVLNQLKKEGYEIQSVKTDIGINPQIIAKKGSQLAFIAVRTACYPEKGKLEESVHFQMIEHADKYGAIPYFASVGIANADAATQEEMSVPVKGAGFYAAYEGMVIITRSDRVKILDEKGLRSVTGEDVQE